MRAALSLWPRLLDLEDGLEVVFDDLVVGFDFDLDEFEVAPDLDGFRVCSGWVSSHSWPSSVLSSPSQQYILMCPSFSQ